jgi:hypothetical protein
LIALLISFNFRIYVPCLFIFQKYFFKSYNIKKLNKFNPNLNFLLLILFEDGEIPRHRYPFDYLMLVFSIYYYKLNNNLFKLDDCKKN